MMGAEHITASVLEMPWSEIAAACIVQEFLQRKRPAWHLVGRVHFNLAENRKDEDAPFAPR